MAKQQTRTSGGAYQNPTEGIVDYGAFGRGFEKNLKPGLDFLKEKQKEKKEEKEPEFDSTVNSASGNDFNFNQKGANSFQESLKEPVLILGEKWRAANGDVQKQQEIFDELNRMNVGKKRAVGFLASFAKNFNASDRRLMPEIVPGLQIERFEESLNKGNARLGFGKDETGSEVFGIHINTVDTDFEAIKAQNAMGRPFPADIAAAIKKDPSLKERLFLNKGIAKADRTADLELFKGPKRTFKATQNLKKIFIPTENLTEEDIMLKYFKPPSNLNKNFALIVKENGVDTKTNEADIVKDVTSVQYLDKNGNIVTATDGTQVLSKNGYEKIDRAAEQVANEIITKDSYRENKDSLYIDVIFGTRKDIALNSQTPIGPYIKGFGEEGFKFDGKSYTEADFLKIGSNGKIGGDIPLSIRNAVSKSYAIDRYKIQKGSFGYHENEFGHAVRSTIPADTKKVTKLDESESKISGAGRNASLEYKKLNLKSIKDLTPSILSNFINSKLSGLEKARVFPIDTSKEIFESTVKSTINPLTPGQNYTIKDAQKMWGKRNKRFPNTGLVFIDNSGELVGLNIKTTEDIAGVMADVYGYKNKGGDRDSFIKSWTEAQFEKQSKNEKFEVKTSDKYNKQN